MAETVGLFQKVRWKLPSNLVWEQSGFPYPASQCSSASSGWSHVDLHKEDEKEEKG